MHRRPAAKKQRNLDSTPISAACWCDLGQVTSSLWAPLWLPSSNNFALGVVGPGRGVPAWPDNPIGVFHDVTEAAKRPADSPLLVPKQHYNTTARPPGLSCAMDPVNQISALNGLHLKVQIYSGKCAHYCVPVPWIILFPDCRTYSLPQGLCTSSSFCLTSGSLSKVLFFGYPELSLNVICSTSPSLITQCKQQLPCLSFCTTFSHFTDSLML